jgi:hypothetical protein
MKSARPSFAVLMLVAVAALPTAVHAQADVLKPAHEFMDTFNKGDIKARSRPAPTPSPSSTSLRRSCGRALARAPRG